MAEIEPRGVQAGLFYERLFWRSSDGPPVVLLPGLLSDGRQLRRLLRELGRKAIVLDPLGSGRSDAPDEADAYLLPALAQRLFALLDALQIERADLIGFSMGGMWAQEALIADTTQRFSRAALVGTSCRVSARLRSTVLGLRAMWQHELPRLDCWRILQSLLFSGEFLERPSAVPLLELLASETKTVRSTALYQLDALLSFNPSEALFPSLAALAKRHVVRAVVGAEFDVLMPQVTQRELAQALGDIPVHIVAQAGHAAWIEQPAALARVLNDALPALVGPA